MANPVKTGDAKRWVYRHSRDHDRQAAEDESLSFKRAWIASGPSVLQAIPFDKGKPGENRRRKASGLKPFAWPGLLGCRKGRSNLYLERQTLHRRSLTAFVVETLL